MNNKYFRAMAKAALDTKIDYKSKEVLQGIVDGTLLSGRREKQGKPVVSTCRYCGETVLTHRDICRPCWKQRYWTPPKDRPRTTVPCVICGVRETVLFNKMYLCSTHLRKAQRTREKILRPLAPKMSLYTITKIMSNIDITPMLTLHERTILKMHMDGNSIKDISNAMGVSRDYVIYHWKTIRIILWREHGKFHEVNNEIMPAKEDIEILIRSVKSKTT